MARTKGFTLIELVAVILVLSLALLGSTSFITWGSLVFVDGADRQRLLEESRFTIERFTRELRNAVPASVRISADSSCIEFVPIVGSGSYLNIPTSLAGSLVELIHDDNYTYQAGDDLVIQADSVNAIYNIANGNRVDSSAYNIVGTGIQTGQLTLTNPHQFSAAYAASPLQRNRYYLVRNQVSYCLSVDDNELLRYEYSTIFNNQPSTAQMGKGQLMAERIANASADDSSEDLAVFSFSDLQNSRVQLYLRLLRAGNEPMDFYHQVSIKNAG